MKNKAGFSLLEMLVVVLIIAILTAIAFPQYRVLTERSRAVEARGILKQVAAAQERYYMETDTFATQLSQLDVNIPWTGEGIKIGVHGIAGYYSVKDQRGNEAWTLLLETNGWIAIIRNGGDYPKCGFAISLAKDSDKQVKCVTPVSAGSDKSYCTKIFAPGSTGQRNGGYATLEFYDM